VHHAKLRGLSTAYLEDGNPNQPIALCLHGFPDNAHVWDPIAPLLSSRFHLIRPFNRGTSPSDDAKGLDRYRLQALTLDWLELINQIDPDQKRKIVLIGHDLGAVMAWELASHLGNRLQNLIIFNGLSLPQMISRWRSPNQLLKSWYIYSFLVPGLCENTLLRIPPHFIKAGYRLAGYNLEIPSDLDRQSLTRGLLLYRGFALDIKLKLLAERKPLISPTLILWGKNDPALNHPLVDELKSDSTNLTIRLLEAGHWPYVEDTKTVNLALNRFFDGGASHATH